MGLFRKTKVESPARAQTSTGCFTGLFGSKTARDIGSRYSTDDKLAKSADQEINTPAAMVVRSLKPASSSMSIVVNAGSTETVRAASTKPTPDIDDTALATAELITSELPAAITSAPAESMPADLAADQTTVVQDTAELAPVELGPAVEHAAAELAPISEAIPQAPIAPEPMALPEVDAPPSVLDGSELAALLQRLRIEPNGLLQASPADLPALTELAGACLELQQAADAATGQRHNASTISAFARASLLALDAKVVMLTPGKLAHLPGIVQKAIERVVDDSAPGWLRRTANADRTHEPYASLHASLLEAMQALSIDIVPGIRLSDSRLDVYRDVSKALRRTLKQLGKGKGMEAGIRELLSNEANRLELSRMLSLDHDEAVLADAKHCAQERSTTVSALDEVLALDGGQDLETPLLTTFVAYAALGNRESVSKWSTGEAKPEIDGARFKKLCEASGLLDGGSGPCTISPAEADLIFTRCCPRGHGRKRLSFAKFLEALRLLAQDKRVHVLDVCRAVAGAGEPTLQGTTPEHVRLADKSTFTGIYARGGTRGGGEDKPVSFESMINRDAQEKRSISVRHSFGLDSTSGASTPTAGAVSPNMRLAIQRLKLGGSATPSFNPTPRTPTLLSGGASTPTAVLATPRPSQQTSQAEVSNVLPMPANSAVLETTTAADEDQRMLSNAAEEPEIGPELEHEPEVDCETDEVDAEPEAKSKIDDLEAEPEPECDTNELEAKPEAAASKEVFVADEAAELEESVEPEVLAPTAEQSMAQEAEVMHLALADQTLTDSPQEHEEELQVAVPTAKAPATEGEVPTNEDSGPPPPASISALEKVFKQYATFGALGNKSGGSHTVQLDGINFAKLIRETGLVNAKLNRASVDLIFRKAATKTRKLPFDNFMAALQLVAAARGQSLEEVEQKVANSAGPQINKSPQPKSPVRRSPVVFK